MQSFERYLRDHKSIREAMPRRGVDRPRLTSASLDEVITVDHIDGDNYRDYAGMLVKVTGSVDLSKLGLAELPVTFTSVSGDFHCADNKLTSLEGCPRKVGQNFYCLRNKKKFTLSDVKRYCKVHGKICCD